MFYLFIYLFFIFKIFIFKALSKNSFFQGKLILCYIFQKFSQHKIDHSWKLLNTFAKSSILDVDLDLNMSLHRRFCSICFWKNLRPATLLKKRFWHRCFSVNFAKFLRTPFFTEQLWWLLLKACCRRKVAAVKSEKLKVFIVKYYDISKIYSVNWTE